MCVCNYILHCLKEQERSFSNEKLSSPPHSEQLPPESGPSSHGHPRHSQALKQNQNKTKKETGKEERKEVGW